MRPIDQFFFEVFQNGSFSLPSGSREKTVVKPPDPKVIGPSFAVEILNVFIDTETLEGMMIQQKVQAVHQRNDNFLSLFIQVS